MVYEGYLAFGGNEIVNSPRAYELQTTGPCSLGWIKDPNCEALREILGHPRYNYENIESAPWYDPAHPESARFFGVYGLGLRGLSDSTRRSQVTEGIRDGGTVGSSRKAILPVRVRVSLAAEGDDAMEYGRAWLNAALQPGACGQHGGECGSTDVEFFSACPPGRALVPDFSEWISQAENRSPNPSFESTNGTLVPIRTNLAPFPATAPTGASGWSVYRSTVTNPVGFLRATITEVSGALSNGIVQYATAAAMSPVAPGDPILAQTEFRAFSASDVVIALQFYTSALEYIAPQIVGGSVKGNPSTWSTVFTSATAPANAAYVRVLVLFPNGAVGDTLDIRNVTVEKLSTSMGGPFSGAQPPKVRVNHAFRPRALSIWGASAANGALGMIADTRFAGGQARLVDYGASTASGSWWVQSSSGFPFAVGEKWLFSFRLAVSGSTTYSRPTIGGGASVASTALAQGEVDHGDGTVTVWAVHQITSAGSGGAGIPLVGGVAQPGAEIRVGNALIEKRNDFAEYFDGGGVGPIPQGYGVAWDGGAEPTNTTTAFSYMYDLDFENVWSGTAHASTSILRGTAASGVNYFPSGVSLAIRSGHWASSGSKSLRIFVPSAVTNTYVAIGGDTGGMRLGMVAGGTYTAMVKLRLSHPQPTSSANARRIQVYYKTTASGSSYLSTSSTPAPNVAGVHDLRLTFTLPADTIEAFVRLVDGSTIGGYGSWWDDFALIPGTYDGAWFDGGNLPADNSDPEIVRTAWTGTANNSISTLETRERIQRPQSDDEWAASVLPYRRNLHGAVVTGFPITVSEHRRNGFVRQEVEFTIHATRPWVYGATEVASLPRTQSSVIQDRRYNLIAQPSMELPGSDVVISRNLSTNPSVEVDATGWATATQAYIGGSINAYVTAGRTTELAASGTASYRARLLADGSVDLALGHAAMIISHNVTIPTTPARLAISFSIWGALVKTAGGTTTSAETLTASVKWLDVSNTTLRTDHIGVRSKSEGHSLSGYVFSAKSIIPPTGAVTAQVVMAGNFAWESSTTTPANNSDIRLYADAVAVTIP